MCHQQSEPNGEQAFSSSYHTDSQEHSALSPAKSQTNGVQTAMTKRQAKDLANTLNDISRTQAGQSFKAPVEQLWPGCADAYAAKIPNPVDLSIIELKVKNNAYQSMDDLRADVILLYQNSVDFNGIDHIVTSAALEVRDTILKAISDMEEGKWSTRASVRGV
ncbi:Bromodomain-containing protein [Mollisia scopiformis]|uniref:Bromodomain-containing protein n=1 Tax=Mollisia scopiformis TaxID=149040 RepID=A0A132B4J9_MOLSC|nr:Bromodomain-containing protein [Mollisia scopiformis]KUJ07251.1 Bromodomain-containing protein [Mollisia scopiformis]